MREAGQGQGGKGGVKAGTWVRGYVRYGPQSKQCLGRRAVGMVEKEGDGLRQR